VFLDRDGVINRALERDGRPYPPQTPDEFEILPGTAGALSLLRGLQFELCVVTNQPDVSRGTQSRAVVEAMHQILRSRLNLRHFYVCYHDDRDQCSCRKPLPGLLTAAAAELNLSLTNSYMIGDRWRDIDCGRAAGCRTIFIDRGYAEELRARPDFIAPDLPAAARQIQSELHG
jgi:D-glycero-D-manno-heptose 1,7-bisphosphate phosphatase